MASDFKRLGASAPSADTDTLLYSPGSTFSAIVSTIYVCNRSANAATFRIAVVDGPIGNVTDEDYLYYDVTVPGNDTFATTGGITLQNTDSILVRAGSSNLSFSAFGDEVS